MDLTSLFDRICSSDMVIVSQQRDEPELSREQKHTVLHQIYTNKPENFVYRFGPLLTDDEIQNYFDPDADYIRQIIKTKRNKIVANRRYAYMQDLISQGTYFSEEAMKERSPLLYEQLIGKYSDGTNLPPMTRTANGPLTDFYMEHLESISHNERVAKELQNEYTLRADDDEDYSDEEEEEEEEDDDDDDDDEDDDGANKKDIKKRYDGVEINMYRNEFLSIHKEMFLNGEDPHVDYRSIDRNENLDDLKILERDEEESYFDEEESFTYENGHENKEH